MAENYIFCSRCGMQNIAQAAFCSKCGAGLGPNPPAPVAAAPVIAYAPPAVSAGYGGFWIRFVAWFIDAFIISVASWPIRTMLSGILHLGRFGMGHYYWGPERLFTVVPFFWSGSIVVSWLYEALMTSSSWQATLGKKMLNLRVTDDAGNRLSFLHATGRHFAKWVSNLTFGVGYAMAGFTDRKRALHDMLAGTLVRKD